MAYRMEQLKGFLATGERQVLVEHLGPGRDPRAGSSSERLSWLTVTL
jgi:hypothetical protein